MSGLPWGVGRDRDHLPEAKGLIEWAHNYLERSFLPGRTFSSPADFNAQLTAWLALAKHPRQAGAGLHAHRPHWRGPGCDACVAAGCAGGRVVRLAAIAPRSPRPLDANDYWVHPAAIGHRVLVRADLDRVQAFCGGELIADHERIWARDQTISDPNHVEAAKVLRRDKIGTLRPAAEPDVQVRALSDYDSALGVDLDGEVAG